MTLFNTQKRNARMLLQIEHKEDMKERGLASPDEADALALTFAQHQLNIVGSQRRHVQVASTAAWT